MIEYERTNLNGVPDYTAVEFEGRRHDYCLLIPVINEGARILTELGRAQKAGIDQLCDIGHLRRRLHRRQHEAGDAGALPRQHAADENRPRQAGRPAAHGHVFCAGSQL